MVNFRQHDERHISVEVKLFKWNPKMDLIAIASKSGDLSVHRLMGWQKVCTLPSPGPHPRQEPKTSSGTEINCIEWRPDGKILAVGYSRNIKCLDDEKNSCVILLDIENGEILHVIEVDDDKVTSLCWESQSLNELHSEDYEFCSYNEYLHKLKPLAKSYSNACSTKLTEDTIDDVMKVSTLNYLNILAVGTLKGHVWLFSFGLFRCGRIIVPGNRRILYLSISKDLRLLNTFCRNVQRDDDDDDAGENCELLSFVLDRLLKNSRQYLFLTRIYCKITSLSLYLNETIQAVQETWEDILLEIDAKLSSYTESTLQDSDSTPKSAPLLADEFLELLVLGTTSDSLEKFMHELTDKGLKKLGHSIELTYSNIQKLVVINMQRVSLHIFCHLSTLRSLSLWKSEFGALGIDVNAVNKALKSVGSFHLKSLELQQVIDISMRNVKCFFRWLYVTMLRLYNDTLPISQTELTKMSQQDVQYIAEFIQDNFEQSSKEDKRPTASNFTLERVGQYLKNDKLNCPYSATYDLSLNPWIQYLKELAEVEKESNDGLHPHNLEKSLVQEHETLNISINEAFSSPFELFNESIPPAFSVIRDATSPTSDVQVSHVTNVSWNCHFTALLQRKNLETILVIMKHDLQRIFLKAMEVVACAFVEAESNKPLTLFDFQFYSEDILSLLLNEQEDNTSYLVQVPIRTLFQHSKRYPISFSIARQLNNETPSTINISENSTEIKCRKLENLRAARLAVTGSRKVACVLSQSKRRVRIFEMDVSEEDEVDEELDMQEQEKDAEDMT